MGDWDRDKSREREEGRKLAFPGQEELALWGPEQIKMPATSD